MTPWTDRTGAPSPIRAVTFAALFMPGTWLIGSLLAGDLGPRPLTELVHESGLWTIRLLFLSLAVTPLRRLLRWPELISVRRMIGVAALAYALLHLAAFAADQMFDLARVAAEIVLRVYLAVGAVALLALVPLGVTSTNGMMKRLGGRRWRHVHQAVYAIALLGTVHFFWQAKLDASEALVMGGLLLWLYGYRALEALAERPPLGLARAGALAIGTGLVTALGEAVYFQLRFGVDAGRILPANVAFEAGWRPAWTVLAICLGVALLATIRIGFETRPKPAMNLAVSAASAAPRSPTRPR
jgi:sulfoxide reductase heme-binding subunit YedZ